TRVALVRSLTVFSPVYGAWRRAYYPLRGTSPVNGATADCESLQLLGRILGAATAYPKARGIWRDDERAGALVKDEPVLIHCYTTPQDIEDRANLAELGRFCRRLGREAKQGEVGLVVGDEYFAIREFEEV